MKKLLIICLIGFGIYGYLQKKPQATHVLQPTFNTEYSASDQALDRAYKNKRSNLQMGGSGSVIKTLPDDLEGSRHQKFILKTATGQTLLVAHNIDLAPRIESLSIGDKVAFYGEYEWNAKGGVIHWTHHDPSGRHKGGWLVHDGNIYK